MSIDKVSRFVAAFTSVAQNQSSTNQSPQVSTDGSGGEAVRFVQGFGQSASQTSSSSDQRQARIDQIKSQVEAGTYKPDSEKVAAALVQELF